MEGMRIAALVYNSAPMARSRIPQFTKGSVKKDERCCFRGFKKIGQIPERRNFPDIDRSIRRRAKPHPRPVELAQKPYAGAAGRADAKRARQG